MTGKTHWENVYAAKTDAELSWTQSHPSVSLALTRETTPPGSSVIDVGGGASVLADRLLDAGYAVAVLDIAPAALARARERLGAKGDRVRWITADVTAAPALGTFDLWHDRAVFHFLTSPADRSAYAALMARTIAPRGHAVIATFAPDGPAKCSGLDVRRYDAHSLAVELGERFEMIKSLPEMHLTPWGKPQSFQYSVFRLR